MSRPSDLDHRVKKLHNVTSTEDLQKKKLDTPGPGSYEISNINLQQMMDSSIGASSNQTGELHKAPFQRRVASGVTIPQYKGERCVFEEGETDSPGPARYSMAEALNKLETGSWVKRCVLNPNFNRAKRSVGNGNLDQQSGLADIAN